MKLDALDHPKTLDFAARLDITRPTAIGHLELLWAFTGKMAPQGNIGKWADGAIARACDWMGDPKIFLNALIEAGLLDVDPTHRLVIHDWSEHAQRWVKAKLKTMGVSFVGTAVPTTDDDADDDDGTAVPTTASTLDRPLQGKPSEAKGREAKPVHEREQEPTDAKGELPRQNRDLTPVASPSTRAHAFADAELMDAFAVVRSCYPNFAGRQDWPNAEHHWRMRIEQGATPRELIAGVERYAAFVAAGGVSGSAFVMTPGKFFSAVDRPWSQAWTPPPTKAETRLGNNLTAAAEFMRRTEPAA